MSPYNVNGSNAARKRESPCRCCYLNLTRGPCCHVMGCRQLPALGAYVRSPCDEEMPSKAHFLSGGGGGGGGGMNWETGVDIYTLICIKWITDENLLYKKNEILKLKKKQSPLSGFPFTVSKTLCSVIIMKRETNIKM